MCTLLPSNFLFPPCSSLYAIFLGNIMWYHLNKVRTYCTTNYRYLFCNSRCTGRTRILRRRLILFLKGKAPESLKKRGGNSGVIFDKERMRPTEQKLEAIRELCFSYCRSRLKNLDQANMKPGIWDGKRFLC
jgi:hypothetical protein